MSKVLVEFINTCPTCDGYSSYLNELQKEYEDNISKLENEIKSIKLKNYEYRTRKNILCGW